MALLPSLPEPAHLADLFGAYPDNVKPLMNYTDGIMRTPGETSLADRELIAAFVSALNECTFCAGSHLIYAEAYGIDPAVLDALLADVGSAPVDERLKPLLAYAAKLNTLPSRLTSADAEAAFAAGWSEKGLYEVIQVCGLFNLMNRLVQGAGVDFDYAADRSRHSVARPGFDIATHRYADFGRRVAPQDR